MILPWSRYTALSREVCNTPVAAVHRESASVRSAHGNDVGIDGPRRRNQVGTSAPGRSARDRDRRLAPVNGCLRNVNIRAGGFCCDDLGGCLRDKGELSCRRVIPSRGFAPFDRKVEMGNSARCVMREAGRGERELQ